MPTTSQRYNKRNNKKRDGYQTDGNAKKAKTSGPLDHYQNTTATTNKWIDINKWTQGALLAHGEDFGVVAQRLELNPGAETAYVDEVAEDVRDVNPDDYDFGDAQQVARYNADGKRAAVYKELVEQRMKTHAAIKEKVDDEALKRAKLAHPDAFASMYTPTGAFLEYIFGAIFQGDKRERQKDLRDRLNKYSQLPDTDDADFINEGRALLVEARALQVAQDESDLVTTGMRNLSPRWKTLM